MAKIKNYCKITQTGKVTKNAKITENGKVTPNVKVNKKKNKKNTDILKKKSILFINDSCHDQESNDSKSADEVELETNIKQEEGNSSNDEVVEEKIYHEDIHKVNGIEKSADKEIAGTSRDTVSSSYIPDDDNENTNEPKIDTCSDLTPLSPEKTKDDSEEATIKFECESCGAVEMCHYKGKNPPFANGVRLLEDSFVMKDPFQPTPPRLIKKPEYFIVVGSNCYICDKVVCRDGECSFFYANTFCITCAKENVKMLPLESQTKLHKQIAANNSKQN